MLCSVSYRSFVLALHAPLCMNLITIHSRTVSELFVRYSSSKSSIYPNRVKKLIYSNTHLSFHAYSSFFRIFYSSNQLCQSSYTPQNPFSDNIKLVSLLHPQTTGFSTEKQMIQYSFEHLCPRIDIYSPEVELFSFASKFFKISPNLMFASDAE